MSQGLPSNTAWNRAAARTNLPGVLLMVTGILNLLGGLYFCVNGWFALKAPEEVLAAAQQGPFGNQQQMTPEMVRMVSVGYLVVGVLAILASGLITWAGVKMRNLESYKLCVTGAVLAAIPAISPCACCMMGMVCGIWSLVVLLDPGVRACFDVPDPDAHADADEPDTSAPS